MQVRGVLLATTAGVVAAPAAFAADLAPMPVKGAIFAPNVSWTGWYVGGHLGGAWQHGDNGIGGASSYSMNSTSFMGGAQIGYNWQRGKFVYGFEADISGFSKSKDQGHSYFSNSNTVEWLSTYRARMGLAVDDVLIYFTGGLAVGGVKNRLVFWDNSGAISGDKTSTKTRVGWTVGGGVEYMWSRNWTIGLEALFVDLGRYGNSGYVNSCTDETCPTSFSNQLMIGRFKMNYKF